MAWIKTISPSEADGLLARIYKTAVKQAGKVFNIMRIQGLLPEMLRDSNRLYEEVMHSPRNTLTRAQREMIATTVSRVNECFY